MLKDLKRLASLVVLLGLAGSAQADVIVGSYDGGNCYPFSCGASDGVTTYQQIYSADAFSGVLTFNAISFFLDEDEGPGLMDSATYTVSFSTTSKAVDGLDTEFANNIGGDSAVFGVFSLSGVMPSILTLTGNAFTYDPTQGNLLMTVEISGLTEANPYESFFQADYTGEVTQRLYAYDGEATGEVATGALVTEFHPVPEPSSVVLGLIGLALLPAGRLVRRRAA